MDESRAARLVQAVLRCYPARWRRRHAGEAAELATLLIRDGTPAVSASHQEARRLAEPRSRGGR